VHLAPSAAGAKLLRHHRKLKLALSITFAPHGGRPSTVKFRGLTA
jgi:hypothetical protein